MNDSNFGSAIVESSLRVCVLGLPMITSGAPFSVLNTPSIEANAGGWYLYALAACWSPVGKICSTQKISAAVTPTVRLIFANVRCLPLSMCQAPIAAITNEPVNAAPLMLCAYCQGSHGLVRKSPNDARCTDLPLPA